MDTTAQNTVREVDALIEEYGQSHQNKVNHTIHWFCIPAIMYSTLGLLYALHPYVAWLVIGLSLIYYMRLSVPMLIGMALVTAAMVALIYVTPKLLITCVAVFVVAWIVQFIGHKIEGKKPSFFKDIFFLLIGPIYLLHFIYRRLGIKY